METIVNKWQLIENRNLFVCFWVFFVWVCAFFIFDCGDGFLWRFLYCTLRKKMVQCCHCA